MIALFARNSISTLKDFMRHEAAGGYVLIVAAACGLIVANSEFAPAYFKTLNMKIGFDVGLFQITESVTHWINDGLMSLFFLLVGLEIKREVLGGHLARASDVLLPAAAAVGGVILPAAIYLSFNASHDVARDGWAIPAATDIAFALGVLALVGSRVPITLKIFLTAVAILDDLLAIVMIAVFYTEQLHGLAVLGAGCVTAALIALNYLKVRHLWVYVLLGGVLWLFMLESGIHATLAGVILALTIPFAPDQHDPQKQSAPLLRLETLLHTPVAFAVVPLFGFANAGVSFLGLSLADLLHPVSIGVCLGLFVGKQIGVFGVAWCVIRMGWARMPHGASVIQLYGVSVLCGIGFTMSLFIGGLAFDEQSLIDRTKIGIFAGSLLSTLTGMALLRFARTR
jgi:NhaA family Na+:H+ antiporter